MADAAKPYGDVAYADPGYQADKKKRYPIDTAEHAKAAWSYINQAGNASQYSSADLAKVKSRITAACKKFGIDVGGQMNSAQHAPDIDVVRTVSMAAELRSFTPGEGSLGRLVVPFSPFNTWYEVNSKFEGRFMERTTPGTFADTVANDREIMRSLFDHGHDPQIGNKVLGPIVSLREDTDSPVGEVDLMDTSYNRDLLPGLKAGVYGSSFRMHVLADDWNDRPPQSAHNPDGIPERTITKTKTLEFGPVTFPANPAAKAMVRSMTDEFYDQLRTRDTSAYEAAARAAGMPLLSGDEPRSLLAQLDPDEHRTLIRELAAELRLAADLEDFTGRPAQGAGGGDPGTQSGNGGAPAMSIRQRLDDGALRARKVLQ